LHGSNSCLGIYCPDCCVVAVSNKTYKTKYAAAKGTQGTTFMPCVRRKNQNTDGPKQKRKGVCVTLNENENKTMTLTLVLALMCVAYLNLHHPIYPVTVKIVRYHYFTGNQIRQSLFNWPYPVK
jgi:hypothetical protein